MLGYEWLCALAPPDLTSFGDSAFASPHWTLLPYRTVRFPAQKRRHRIAISDLVCGISMLGGY